MADNTSMELVLLMGGVITITGLIIWIAWPPRRIALLCGFAALVICACTPTTTQPWQSSDLAGYRYEFWKGHHVYWYMFSEDGWMVSAIGNTKDPMWTNPPQARNMWTGSPYRWQITNGVLLLTDPFNDTLTFAKISVYPKKAVVLASGQRMTWLRLKNDFALR